MTGDPEPDVDVRELFRLLGNETRMGIMRALWDRFEFQHYVVGDQDPTSFARLREAAGVEDPGNFNYHLDQLTGTLVDQREGGYVLSPLGYNLLHAIDRYRDYEYSTREEWTVGADCPFCDGRLVADYRRDVLSVRCRDCGGLASEGNFTFVELPATGTGGLSGDDLLDVATLAMFSKIRASKHGFCWDCNARMRTDITHCQSHTRGSDGICPECSLRFRTNVDATCETCGTSGHGPVVEYALLDPRVARFLDGHGRSLDQVGPWQYRLGAFRAVRETALDTDPTTVEVVFGIGEETMRVALRAGEAGIETSTRTD
jgi:hypothetical protein